MTKLILTRHGETLENRQNIMQGVMPGRLSPLGIEQAHELARQLEETSIDHIISSDLARSFDTARIIAERQGKNVEPTTLLREIDWGPHTGGKLNELDWHCLPAGCEGLDELYQRAVAFVEYVTEHYPNSVVLAVGHGAIDRAITAYLTGKKAQDMPDMPIIKNTFCLYFDL